MTRVFLVGAGPGDPELLTVRALSLLRRADVVLHDALISPEILALIAAGAQVIDVGKRCGQKLLTQEEINDLLVHYGSKDGLTVRLKSGDPTIFGRLGEEIQALREAGIGYEIVPGITSALAGAAAAGISLTDRRFASSVVFATAHHAAGNEALEWERLVSSGSTLVIYMPGTDYGQLAERLSTTGLAANTACAVVSRAGQTKQQILWTTLEQVGRCAALPSPSLFIVGSCVGEFVREELPGLKAQFFEAGNGTAEAVP